MEILNTLDMVRDDKVMLAVIAKTEQEGMELIGADRGSVTVKAGCLPVEITWEMCSCHGGRMWFTQKKTNIHVELSSDEYDEEKGIVDPDTELAWYIDNRMAEEVREFEKYVYVVEEDGKCGSPGRKDTKYFKSIEDASRYVFDEPGHDLMSEYGEVVHQYPNPDYRRRVTFVKEEGGALFFKGEKLYRRERNGAFEVEYEYGIKFRVFRKKVR